jgi:sRNA-binding regulator protein Hfq
VFLVRYEHCTSSVLNKRQTVGNVQIYDSYKNLIVNEESHMLQSHEIYKHANKTSLGLCMLPLCIRI